LRVLIGSAVHRQAALLGAHDFRDEVVTTAATSGSAALITDLGNATGAGSPNGATDVSIAEGVAVTHEHRVRRNLAY
jgi:hypothetical protein